MHPSFRDDASLARSLQERSGVLLWSLWDNVFSSHDFFEGDVVWIWKSWFWKNTWEVEMVPPSVPKFVITNFLNKKNLYCISRNLVTISNICYKWRNVKSSNSITVLRGWFSTQKSWSLTWKSSLRGRWHNLCVCSLLLGSLDIFFSLKKKVLTWKFDLSGSRHVWVFESKVFTWYFLIGTTIEHCIIDSLNLKTSTDLNWLWVRDESTIKFSSLPDFCLTFGSNANVISIIGSYLSFFFSK